MSVLGQVPVGDQRNTYELDRPQYTSPWGEHPEGFRLPVDASLVLDKPNLRRGDGPVLFVEYFLTSYDPTPYLAIDQLAYHAQQGDPLRRVLRAHLVEFIDRTEILLFEKRQQAGWELASAAVILDPLQFGDLYHQARGDEVWARQQVASKARVDLITRLQTLGICCRDEASVAADWVSYDSHMQSEVSSRFRDVVVSTEPSVVACTADSKVFSRLKYVLDRNRGALDESLVMLGGIHANAARDTVAQNEAFSPDRPFAGGVFDLIHYAQSGEQDFCAVLECMQFPDLQRISALARLPNFVARVRVAGDVEPFNHVLVCNDEVKRVNSEVARCPSGEQMPTSWGKERPVVRRLKGSWGCQFSCTFCATAGGFAPGDVEATRRFFDSVLEELSGRLIKPESVLVYFEDANFAGAYASKVLELASQYPFKLGVQIRYDCVPKAMPKLEVGGVDYLFLGLESYDDAVRAEVNKKNGLTPSRMYQIASDLKTAGMDFLVSGIVGLPGEDAIALARTVAFARIQSPQIVSLELPKVYPGTPLAEEYMIETGRDVGEMYTRGEGLVASQQAGMESIGSVLMPHLTEDRGIEILSQADRFMLMPLPELLAIADMKESFAPLGSTRYERDDRDVGFYRRVQVP